MPGGGLCLLRRTIWHARTVAARRRGNTSRCAVGMGVTVLRRSLVCSLDERRVAERKVVRLVTVPDFLRELRAGSMRRDRHRARVITR